MTITVKPDGTFAERNIPRINLRSSWQTNFQVWTCERTGHLGVSGNPVKFIQGHNVYAPPGNVAICAAINQITKMLDLGEQPGNMPEDIMAAGRLTRTDIAENYVFSSPTECQTALMDFQTNARAKYWREKATVGTTTYFGKRSRHTYCKMYGKGDEINVHHISRAIPEHQRALIKMEAQNMARFEVTLADKYCAKHDLKIGDLTEERIDEIFQTMFDRIEFTPSMNIATDEILQLSDGTKIVYFAWKLGHDLNALGMAARTLRRHKTILREQFGINVDVPVQEQKDENMISIEEWNPAEQPKWADLQNKYGSSTQTGKESGSD